MNNKFKLVGIEHRTYTNKDGTKNNRVILYAEYTDNEGIQGKGVAVHKCKESYYTASGLQLGDRYAISTGVYNGTQYINGLFKV